MHVQNTLLEENAVTCSLNLMNKCCCTCCAIMLNDVLAKCKCPGLESTCQLVGRLQ